MILPASSFLEKHGTFTNAERRHQLVEPAIDPPGEAKTDFEIIAEVSRALGHETGWNDTRGRDARDRVRSRRISPA